MNPELSEFGDRENAERLEAEHPEESMRRREFLAKTAALAGAAGLASRLPLESIVSGAARVQTAAGLPSPRNIPIRHFLVVMMENRSFDHYFGWHPEADAKNAGLSYPDEGGSLHPTHSLAPDFQGCAFEDPDHSWEGGRRQYDGGRLDGFRKPPNDDFAIGYYDREDIPFALAMADAFTLYDRYFCSLLGPTWPNREYMYSAQSGGNKTNGSVDEALSQALQGGLYRWETIFDRMMASGLSVAYYYSDLPFIGVFGRRYLPILRPIAQYYADAAAGNLPNLAFVDPMFVDGGGGNGLSGDEHPHGDIRIGQAFLSAVVRAFVASPQFRTGAMFVNYDEWGGFFDHVAPRLVPDDRQSPDLAQSFGVTGFRIPGVAVSPFARRGHVSHMTVTHESILKLISYKFGLGFLNKRHRYASNIGSSFDWENPRLEPPDLPVVPPPMTTPCDAPAQPARSSAAPDAEGLSIGSPEMAEYLDRLGYPTEPAKPEEVFNSSAPEVRRLARQLSAQGLAR